MHWEARFWHSTGKWYLGEFPTGKAGSEMLDGRIVFHSPSELPEDTRNRRKKLLTSKPSDPWQAAGRWMAGRASAGRLDTEKKYLFKERGLGRGIPRLSQIGRPADDGKRLDSLSPAMDVAS